MRFLIDTNPPKVESWVAELPEFVVGQLIVPANSRRNWGGVFACDNSAFKCFNRDKFKRLQFRQKAYMDKCLFVSAPDVVGNMRRTLELWKRRDEFAYADVKLTLVVQDGAEDMEIPWDETPAIFVGGGDPWKDSKACLDIVRTAKIFGKHVHVGRVNQIKRYRNFAEVKADTCDGSSIALHDYKLRAIARDFNKEPDPVLFNEDETEENE
jgi:hypothetical protein